MNASVMRSKGLRETLEETVVAVIFVLVLQEPSQNRPLEVTLYSDLTVLGWNSSAYNCSTWLLYLLICSWLAASQGIMQQMS